MDKRQANRIMAESLKLTQNVRQKVNYHDITFSELVGLAKPYLAGRPPTGKAPERIAAPLRFAFGKPIVPKVPYAILPISKPTIPFISYAPAQIGKLVIPTVPYAPTRAIGKPGLFGIIVPSLFVTVASDGTYRVMTSPDGITWTLRDCTLYVWKSVCFANGLFVAVGYENTPMEWQSIMTSSDGVTWTLRLHHHGNVKLVSVCYGNGLFVALNGEESATYGYTSPDGITWTYFSIAGTPGYYPICWSPELSLFVTMESSYYNQYSSNGRNWTRHTNALPYGEPKSICWSPTLGLFIAVGEIYYNGGKHVYTSSNGINWTARGVYGGNSAEWNSVCWSPELSLLVAVGNTSNVNCIMTSANGINWTIRIAPVALIWKSVCWNSGLNLFVAVASSGTGNRVMTSPDGITWTIRASAADNSWCGICHGEI